MIVATQPCHALADRIVDIDRQILELTAQREELMRNVVADFEWMDVAYVTAWVHARDAVVPGDVLHVVEAVYKDGTTHGVDAHSVSACPGRWCRRAGETRWTRGRDALGFRFRGEYRAVMSVDEYNWIVIPQLRLSDRGGYGARHDI